MYLILENMHKSRTPSVALKNFMNNIELVKENCDSNPNSQNIAQMTLVNFFDFIFN